MTEEDFIKLSPALQKEYTLATCDHLISIPAGKEYSIELFHSLCGNFFVELYYQLADRKIILIKSYNGTLPLNKFLHDIDIKEVYRILNSRY